MIWRACLPASSTIALPINPNRNYIPQKTNVATVTCVHGLNGSGDWARSGDCGMNNCQLASSGLAFTNSNSIVQGNFYKPDTVLDTVRMSRPTAEGVIAITGKH